jgi:hypothetical protein
MSDFSLVNPPVKYKSAAQGQQNSYSLNVYLQWNGTLHGNHQRLALVGEIPELGQWKEAKVFLKQESGGIWKLTNPLITSTPYFRGKFAVIDPHAAVRIGYERGIDRIFDLEILPSLSHAQASNYMEQAGAYKHCELHCEWEAFTVTFSVSHPLEGFNDEMVFMGDKEETKNVPMVKEPQPIHWMFCKYGDKNRPWEYSVKFPNIEAGVDAVWLETAVHNRFSYQYGKRNKVKGELKWEREPKRTLNI